MSIEIELYKIIKQAPSSLLLGRIVDSCYLPCESVGIGPRIATSMLARAFDADHWLVDGMVVDYEHLRKSNDFSGTGGHNAIHLWEVWMDCGDDGHTQYEHQGWAYIDRNTLQAAYKSMNEWSRENRGMMQAIEDIIREREFHEEVGTVHK